MIRLTRLKGDVPLFLNEDLIETIDGHHDTTITLTNGDKYVVTEKPEQVFNRIVEVRAVVNAVAQRLADDEGFDHTAFLGAIVTGRGE